MKNFDILLSNRLSKPAVAVKRTGVTIYRLFPAKWNF